MKDDAHLVKSLKSRRSPAGYLYLSRTSADQLFRWIECVESILKTQDESISKLKELVELYKRKGEKHAVTSDVANKFEFPSES